MPNTTDQVTTAEQLAAMPNDGKRYELVEGVLHMMSPAGSEHGEIAAKLLVRIANHVEPRRIGKTFAAETGFLIRRDPDTVLAPDVSFVSFDRLGRLTRHPGYLPLAPDLVAEVVSPSDRFGDVETKARTWIEAGVLIVLVVDPQSATIRDYRSADRIQVHSDGFLDLDDVLPGFQLDVADLFA
ncbi:MAG: Uma2 family endonuclease [Pirellulaceae bacterium]|nr:Uma2 family endonuclease [Pirellulaceae bacterium]